LLLVLDVLALVIGFTVGYWGRLNLPVPGIIQPPDVLPEFYRYAPTIALNVVIIIVMLYFARQYHLPRIVSRIDQGRRLIGVVTVGALIGWPAQEFLFKYSIFEFEYTRGLFFYNWIFSCLFILVARELHGALRNRVRAARLVRDNLLLIGNGRIAKDIARKIMSDQRLGYNIVGVVVSGKEKTRNNVYGIPVIGTFEDIPSIIDSWQVAQVIIALPEVRRNEMLDIVTRCQRGRVDIKIYPDLFAYMAGDLNVDDLGGTPLLTVRDIALRGWKLSLKRGLDMFGSGAGLVLLSPMLLLTAFLMRREGRGPIFYTQERMGLDGRPFHMIKFRTMRPDAEAAGPGWTVKDDPRVTRLGRWMRKTNWDELPQLINVFLGEMSLVGPRPERPIYVLEFRKEIPRYMERHREKSGMTGWAQVNGLRGDTSIPERTRYDLWYVENWSLWLDIKIIVRTIWQTVTRQSKNAY
jgi:exopolysaccharide biosynthesis polyprenyl glycosylphosphotransferase